MGWASANPIFDETARELIKKAGDARGLDATDGDRIVTDVLTVLIRELQVGDWDTEQESLREFADNEAVVEAFRRNKVIRHCGAEHGGLLKDWCERERGDRGHADGMHEDYRGSKWPVSES